MLLETTLLLASLAAQAPELGPLEGTELPAMDLDRVRVGETAPDFRLADQEGRVHQLSRHRGRKNVVLVFYRGHW